MKFGIGGTGKWAYNRFENFDWKSMDNFYHPVPTTEEEIFLEIL
jgi:hypothetical protein